MSEVTSYHLTGDWRHIVDDGLVDTDALPDEALPTGHVEFIPVIPQVAVAGSPETAYTVSSFKALVAAGVLTDLQGREGVSIAGKIGDYPILWRAKTHLEFRGQKLDYPTVEFTLDGDARLTGILASQIPGVPATIYHPRIETLITELDGKANVVHAHQITDVVGLQQALEEAANSGGGGGTGGSGGPVSWTQVTGKPTEFPPASHVHPIVDVTGLQAALDAKVGADDPRLSDARPPTAHSHSWTQITGKPTTFPPELHTHTISDVAGLQQALEDAAASGGGEGGSGGPVSWTLVTNKPTEFPPEAHSHVIGDVTGLQAELNGKVDTNDPRLTDARPPTDHSHTWTSITSKPTSFPPATHTHVIGDTTGLQAALDGKVGTTDPRLSDARPPTAHTHPVADVTGLQAALDAKAAASHSHTVSQITATGTASSTTYLRGDGTWATPTNTTYTVVTQAAVEAGTETTARAVSAATLKGAVQRWATGSYTTAITATGQALNAAADAAAARTAIGAVATTDPRLTDARTPTAHSHTISDVTGLQAALDAAAASGGSGGALTPGSVQTDHIADGAVTRPKIVDFAVSTNQIAPASVIRAHLNESLRTELDGLRTDVNAKVGANDPRLTDARTPTAHTHPIADVTGLQTALDAKAGATHTHVISEVTGLQTSLDAKANTSHTHQISEVSGLQAALDAAAASGGGGGESGPRLHIEGHPYTTTSQIPNPVVGERFWRVGLGILALYDGTYWYNAPIAPGNASVSTSKVIDDAITRAKLAPAVRTELDNLRTDLNGVSGGGSGPVSWASITDKPATFTPSAHTHSVGDVTGLQDALDGKAGTSDPRLTDARTPTAHTHLWADITDKPTTFAPAAHAHGIGDVTGLQGALDGKANAAHAHTAADVGAVANLGGITGAISITRAAYDALGTKDPTVLYAIREA